MTVVFRLVLFVASMSAATIAWLASGLLLDYVNIESTLLRGLCSIALFSLGVRRHQDNFVLANAESVKQMS
jgi:hypothetical protein